MPFTSNEVHKVSSFLQDYMKDHNIESMFADECAQLLAENDILPNTVGPKPGFNFRQMLRDGRDGLIPFTKGAYQRKPNTRWFIYRVDE